MELGCLLPNLSPAATGVLLGGAPEVSEDLLKAGHGARQHDGAVARFAKLLLGHVEELPEGVAGEAADGNEEPAAVPGVGREMAPRARPHRGRCTSGGGRGGDLAASTAVPFLGDIH